MASKRDSGNLHGNLPHRASMSSAPRGRAARPLQPAPHHTAPHPGHDRDPGVPPAPGPQSTVTREMPIPAATCATGRPARKAGPCRRARAEAASWPPGVRSGPLDAVGRGSGSGSARTWSRLREVERVQCAVRLVVEAGFDAVGVGAPACSYSSGEIISTTRTAVQPSLPRKPSRSPWTATAPAWDTTMPHQSWGGRSIRARRWASPEVPPVPGRSPIIRSTRSRCRVCQRMTAARRARSASVVCAPCV